jgi:hypothetical protein
LLFIPKPSIFCKRLKNFVVLTTHLFCNEKKRFLELFFPANLDIFRTNNAKRIKFMHDFWRWWLIFFPSDSFCKRLDFTKNFTLKTFSIKESRVNLKFKQCWYREIFRCATFWWMFYSSLIHRSRNDWKIQIFQVQFL